MKCGEQDQEGKPAGGERRSLQEGRGAACLEGMENTVRMESRVSSREGEAKYNSGEPEKRERPCAQPGSTEAPEVERLGMSYSKVGASRRGGPQGPQRLQVLPDPRRWAVAPLGLA